MDVRESSDGKRVVPLADRRILPVAFGALGLLQVLRRDDREAGRWLHDRDERRVQHGADAGDADASGGTVDDRGYHIHHVAPRYRVEGPVEFRHVLALRGLRGELGLGDEVAPEHLLGALLEMYGRVVPEEAPELVLRVAVPCVLEERGHRLRRVLLAELGSEEALPAHPASVVRRVDADAVLRELRAARVVRRGVPEADAARSYLDALGNRVRPFALPDFGGDDVERDVDHLVHQLLRLGLEEVRVPHDDLLGGNTARLAELVPLSTDVHDLRRLLGIGIIPDTPPYGLYLRGDDVQELGGVGVPGYRDRAVERPDEVQASRLRDAPPPREESARPLLPRGIDDVLREHAVVVGGEPVQHGALVSLRDGVRRVLALAQGHEAVLRVWREPALLVLVLWEREHGIVDLELLPRLLAD